MRKIEVDADGLLFEGVQFADGSVAVRHGKTTRAYQTLDLVAAGEIPPGRPGRVDFLVYDDRDVLLQALADERVENARLQRENEALNQKVTGKEGKGR